MRLAAGVDVRVSSPLALKAYVALVLWADFSSECGAD